MAERRSGLRFVDAHVHFWDHSVSGLHWSYLDPGFDHPRLKGMHMLDAPRFTRIELDAQAGEYAPTRVVHIQSCVEEQPGRESAWIQSIAEEGAGVDALVAWARLAEPTIAEVVASNRLQPLYRGVRDMASSQTVGSDEFTAGYDVVAETDSVVELLVPHAKFGEVAELAARRPETTIVLGHAGQPEQRDREYFSTWADELGVLSGHRNVVVKISALASGADPGWTVQSLRPWFERCVEVFGPDRAMLGTNWPIDRLFGTYEQLVEAYLELASVYSTIDREQLFAATANRVYRLPDSTDT